MLFAAVACNVTGFAWLATAMDVHWQQVRESQQLSGGMIVLLRVLGVCALVLSLLLCLLADHVTMAPLVWVMSLTAAALIVAFTLAWRPRLLRPFVIWVPVANATSQ
jgi:uncharacterized protein DUF3325